MLLAKDNVDLGVDRSISIVVPNQTLVSMVTTAAVVVAVGVRGWGEAEPRHGDKFYDDAPSPLPK